MHKVLMASAAFAAVALTSTITLADTVVIEPEVDTWIMEQPDAVVTYEGDVVVGTALPDTVQIVEVPKHKKYGYVMLNKKRVLVDRNNRKVIKLY